MFDKRSPGHHSAAVLLTMLPAVGWLYWLAVYNQNLPSYCSLGLICTTFLLSKTGTWFRWTPAYVVCVAQAAIAVVWYAVNIVLRAESFPEELWVALFASVGCILFLIVAASMLDLVWFLGRRRFPVRDAIRQCEPPATWPGVCFQVPAYDEPPEMVINTISQLMQQDYPGKWMVQVIDNNTPDVLTWHPVRDFCAEYGDRIAFMHLDNWPGHKAGALNEGIRRLPSWVEHVAIVDADYLVAPDFLQMVVRQLADIRVAFVQTPQSYHGWRGSRFRESVFYMYEEYYQTRKPGRREVNGVICVGTMAVIRRSAIEEAGFWDETSCTEDAEVSVRLLGNGWLGLYDDRVKGVGIMPLDFNGLRRQRFRWALGMMHIFRKHWRLLFGLPQNGQLTLSQQLSLWGLANQYLAAWVPVASIGLLTLAVGDVMLGNGSVRVQALLLLPLAALFLQVWTTIACILLATRDDTRPIVIAGTIAVGWSLSWVTAWACICAFVSRRVVFLRTPKTGRDSTGWQVLRTALPETVLATASTLLMLWSLEKCPGYFSLIAGLLAIMFACAPLVTIAYVRNKRESDKIGIPKISEHETSA
ncbi:glycosyltransferase [Glaciimonas immobilis]|uniref:Beta-monoglucosyldiacylglycerol synthase n=1 Tax=Glaciimonas immobilis TaxID=728004 RepID=A0A840RT40_9BURK|nr:glycosyltransferase [Glaciimonas immobilis]KAF3996822.1 glycosyltransferase [Glaciimonas immobilis]MBB5199629.1 cellulose synthase/poly-beta-1,6-N-acetylglucosamine synthase-like glycosyltransferase [Glaciimonas immobilis]